MQRVSDCTASLLVLLSVVFTQSVSRLVAQDSKTDIAVVQGLVPKNLQTEQLVAWCIVPFDAAKRGPWGRADMLKRLGLTRMAYDWREEHVASWDDEIAALRKHGIELTAFWCTSSMEPVKANQRILDFVRKHKLKTQLWMMLPENELSKIEDETRRVETAAASLIELAGAAGELDCQVGLYNHGGWSGRPETLLKIMRACASEKNVGLVYNFHHAHHDLQEFPQAMTDMLPHLLCVNLNGTTPSGPKIQTIGEGTKDKEILEWLLAADYRGPVGILDHRNELDAEVSLQANIRGLERLYQTLDN